MNALNSFAPVALFVYGRPDHTKRTLDSLASNRIASQTALHIFSDAPKSPVHFAAVQAVREVIRNYSDAFASVTIIEQTSNQGLANSIISGVSSLLRSGGGRIIVVEDDLETANGFLSFMNDALNCYESDPAIFSISGYLPPGAVLKLPNDCKNDVLLVPRHCSWGWAIWQDRWATIDWQVSDYPQFRDSPELRASFNQGGPDMADTLDMQMRGEVDSWAIRCAYAAARQRRYTVYPRVSFVDNIGLDGTGVHCGENPRFRNSLGLAMSAWHLPRRLKADQRVIQAFRLAHRMPRRNRLHIWLRDVVERAGLLPTAKRILGRAS